VLVSFLLPGGLSCPGCWTRRFDGPGEIDFLIEIGLAGVSFLL
jgi:hypothetical protein